MGDRCKHYRNSDPDSALDICFEKCYISQLVLFITNKQQKGGAHPMINQTAPVEVQMVELQLDLLPDWRSILDAVPVGCGIKGGVARKILKVIAGLKRHHADFAAELNGDGDLDVLVAVPQVTPQLRLDIRHTMTGQRFGNMILGAKDIEVCDDLARYFRTRDITMNEALAFRVSESSIVLLYTEEARHDVSQGVIRPSIHCLHSGFMQNWEYGSRGLPVISPKPLARCIIRYLKGHGLHYEVDGYTWTHYRQDSVLDPRNLFRVLRHFVDDGSKFADCMQHLTDLGLIAPGTNGNVLWGDCMKAVNDQLALYGQRLTFGEPSAEAIERWMELKERQYQEWLSRRRTLTAIGQAVEPDQEAAVYLPSGWENFPVFYELPSNDMTPSSD